MSRRGGERAASSLRRGSLVFGYHWPTFAEGSEALHNSSLTLKRVIERTYGDLLVCQVLWALEENLKAIGFLKIIHYQVHYGVEN
jgi:hypothetical protein